jgi:hypothetical protein
MKNPIPFVALVVVAVPVCVYGAINQLRMNRRRQPRGLRLNPFSADGLTTEGLLYRRRALTALVALLALGVLEFLVAP